MAKALATGRDRPSRENEDGWETRGDRKVRAGASGGQGSRGAGGREARDRGSAARFPQARKPLVEKKRRARINESLQELRLLLAGAEVRRAGGRPGTAGRESGVRGAAWPHRPPPTPPGSPAGAGAGQAGERRGAGADGAACAGHAAGPCAR